SRLRDRETGRLGDKETGRQGDRGIDGAPSDKLENSSPQGVPDRLLVSPSPCLLVSPSPCLLVSLSPCLLVSLSPSLPLGYTKSCPDTSPIESPVMKRTAFTLIELLV